MVHCRIAQKVHVDNEKDRFELNGLNTLNVFFLWSVKVCEHNGFIDFSLRVPRLSICLQRLWRNSPGGFTPSTWCGSRGTRSPRPSPMSLNRCGFISAHRFMVIVVLIKVFLFLPLCCSLRALTFTLTTRNGARERRRGSPSSTGTWKTETCSDGGTQKDRKDKMCCCWHSETELQTVDRDCDV